MSVIFESVFVFALTIVCSKDEYCLLLACLVTIVFETYPAPVYLEPPSLCLVISFLFCIGVIKRG